jgi:hypothetical protein
VRRLAGHSGRVRLGTVPGVRASNHGELSTSVPPSSSLHAMLLVQFTVSDCPDYPGGAYQLSLFTFLPLGGDLSR